MTHKEIVKEADRISNSNKSESWHHVFDDLKQKENVKLNHSKLYECIETSSWAIKIDEYENMLLYPFGFFCADYFNQLLSLQNKETFIAYEKRMRSGAASEKEVNPTFDKPPRFFVWTKDECPGYYAVHPSDKELEDTYNECSWLWDYVKKDVKDFMTLFKISSNNQLRQQDVIPIYNLVRGLIWKVTMLKIDYGLFNKAHEYNKIGYEDLSEDEAEKEIDIEIKERLNEIEEISSKLSFIEENSTLHFRYMGYETLIYTDSEKGIEKSVFCKKYDIPNLLFLVPEDLMYFLLHQTTHTFGFCPECGCMFVTTHGNQKHCPACNLIIRQKKRKQNKARYLHKKITDYINNYRSGEIENASELFRSESNYYWAIVQGKKPEKVKGYSTKIKTEADYMAWLEKKYEELKAQK